MALHPPPRMRLRLMRAALVPFVLSVAGFTSSCGDSPTPTTPNPPAAAATVTQVTVTGSAPAAGLTSQLAAMAALSDGSTRDVTAQAAWSSSNAAIATVSNTGLVLGVSAGSTDITAAYQGRNGSIRLDVVVPRYRLNGLVTDVQAGYVLADAEVRVTAGPNLGAIARTDSSGRYAMADLLAGTMTIRAEARQSTWSPLERTVTLSSDSDLDFALPRADDPNPAPPAPPPPSFGTGVFLFFVTDSLTCDCSKGTIRIDVNGRRLGTTNCKTDEKRFEVGPGSYRIRVCDDLGCWDTTEIDVEEGDQWELLLTCTSTSGLRRMVRTAGSPVSEWLFDALNPYLPRAISSATQRCTWVPMPRPSRTTAPLARGPSVS